MTTKGVPYSWEISQPGGNDEGTDISRYSSLGAPVPCQIEDRFGLVNLHVRPMLPLTLTPQTSHLPNKYCLWRTTSNITEVSGYQVVRNSQSFKAADVIIIFQNHRENIFKRTIGLYSSE